MAREFDPSRLDAVAADAPDLVSELVVLFTEDVAARLARLREAIASGDDESTKRTAHGIKGAASNIGADRLASLAEALEYPEAGSPRSSADPLDAEFRAISAMLTKRYCE